MSLIPRAQVYDYGKTKKYWNAEHKWVADAKLLGVKIEEYPNTLTAMVGETGVSVGSYDRRLNRGTLATKV